MLGQFALPENLMTTPVPATDLSLQRARRFFEYIQHGQVLGLEVVSYQSRSLLVKLPYRPEIVGNPYAGHIHSGAVSVLVDQTSGAAVMLELDQRESVATLDLRIDHLRPAKAGEALYAKAECYRLAREVGFVRCVCYEDDPADPVATSMSTFMRLRSRQAVSSTGAGESNRG
jgi:uncharacterized protein (TIGR00369 family)